MNWGFKGKKVREMEDEIRRLNDLVDSFKALYLTATDRIIELEKKHRKPRRKELSHKVGFKHVSKEDSIEIYEMWKNHIPLSDIALHFKRSNSTVANHVRKQMEEEDAREQQVESLLRRKTIRTKEEE